MHEPCAKNPSCSMKRIKPWICKAKLLQKNIAILVRLRR